MSQLIAVRFNLAEADELKAQALSAKTTQSEFVRQAVREKIASGRKSSFEARNRKLLDYIGVAAVSDVESHDFRGDYLMEKYA